MLSIAAIKGIVGVVCICMSAVGRSDIVRPRIEASYPPVRIIIGVVSVGPVSPSGGPSVAWLEVQAVQTGKHYITRGKHCNA